MATDFVYGHQPLTGSEIGVLFRDLATSPAGGRDQAPQINAREDIVEATKRLMRDEKITYEAALAKASRARKAG